MQAGTLAATMTEAPPDQRSRLLDIDRAKGLAIILVVFGHLFQEGTRGETPQYHEAMAAIYQFHMPFFMYLSGFVFFLTNSHHALERGYGRFASKRFDRLMIPFLTFGLIVICGKYLFAQFGPIYDSVPSISDGIWAAISNSEGNPTISIWYLVVLFVYSLAMPLLWRIAGGRLTAITLVALALYFAPVTERFYLARLCHYFPFFCIGGLMALHQQRFYPLLRKWGLVLLILFAGVLATCRHLPEAMFICGLFSLPALHGLMLQPFVKHDIVLLFIGQNSMAIYLMNTIFIGLAKLFWFRLLPYEGMWNMSLIATLLATGIIGPMAVRAFINHFSWMRPVGRYLQ